MHRSLLAFLLLAACAPGAADSDPGEPGSGPAEAAASRLKTAEASGLYALDAATLDGRPASLAEYSGQVTLVVNVASRCGYTPQYAGLQQLQEKYADRGFTILGFPSNDFGQQEPGTPEEIREFCSSKFGVTFPLFSKVVTQDAEGQSPVYAWLGSAAGSLPSWNFCKYLVARDGSVLAFFPSKVAPESEALTAAIESALNAG